MITRVLDLSKNLEKGKVTVVYGPRQVGKTTLVKNLLEGYIGEVIYEVGDNLPFSVFLNQRDLDKFRERIPPDSLLVIDEAQKIRHIGEALKLIVDNIKGVTVLITGSSSFDLKNRTGEPLTGRKKVTKLYPISYLEAKNHFPAFTFPDKLNDFLIYGMYPRVVTQDLNSKKAEIISEIADSYLIRDILEFDKIRDSKKILDLLRLLAFQIGSQVSTTELASSLDIDKNTVANYLDLLEKSFVVHRLDGFSRNLRKEVTKMSKYYFYDNGIRNALIANFNDLDKRNDLGQLWENFCIIEKIKHNHYQKQRVNYYFWRTYDQQEIDLVEEKGGKLHGWEFKFKNKKVKPPSDWLKNYTQASFNVVAPDNLMQFLST